jgi:hypothetical protein
MDKQNVLYSCNKIIFTHKKNKVLTHAATQMNFENIVPTEISATRYQLYEIRRLGKFLDKVD